MHAMTRNVMSFLTATGVVALAACLGAESRPADGEPQAAAAPAVALDTIKLPAGFRIEQFATDVKNARSMARGAKGTIFVGSRSAGNVYAIVDANGDYKADRVVTIATGLNMPNGVAFRDGALYVAEVNRILRYDGIEDALDKVPAPVVVNASLPSDRHHGWKFIAFGPDGWLYVPVGGPCNVCDRSDTDERYATVLRMKPDGTGTEVFARGVRNTVGFDWHPSSKQLWFTDNGRDNLGDDQPGDELNHAPQAGLHFGFPYCHAGTIPDPEFGGKRACSDLTPPARVLAAHVAAIGMRFYTGTMFPAPYRGRIFVAEHGSWNRTVPQGYRVMMATLDGDKVVAYEPFAEGWLQGAKAWGRPADVLVLPDGSLLVSDDTANRIYRISYGG
jgi:glucose/arabinose dehydrogenase